MRGIIPAAMGKWRVAEKKIGNAKIEKRKWKGEDDFGRVDTGKGAGV
jgi:hypothetical protein